MFSRLMNYGALASLGCAATFVFGFVLLVTQLIPYINLKGNPEQAVLFVIEHHAMLSVWNFVIYVLFGILLAILVIVLHEQISSARSVLGQLSTVMGVVWVGLVLASGLLANVGLARVVEIARVQPDLAPSLWLAVTTMIEGLGGGNEIIGGLWVLLVSVDLWRQRIYTKALAIIGVLAGATGIASTVPLLSDLGAVFGLSLIAWFVYLGRLMMYESHAENGNQR